MYKRSSALEQQFRYCRFFPCAQYTNFKTQTKNSALLSHTPLSIHKERALNKKFIQISKQTQTEITVTFRVIYE